MSDILFQKAHEELEAEINRVLDNTNYFVSDFCLNLNTDKGYRKLCNFTILPKEFIKKDNGKSIETFVKVCGHSLANVFPEVVLPLKEFESMNWITSKWGFNPVIEVFQNAVGHIKHVTQLLGCESAKTSVIYTHTGWKNIDGDWVYLHSSGAINKENISVELDGYIQGYAFPDPCSDYFEAVATSYSLKKIAPSEISIPLLGLTYLCPLNEFFKQAGYEPSFISMLVGQTGTMKSTIAALTLCHFGEFTAKSLPGSFKDTSNALEAKAFILKDTLNVIDDFHPTTQRGNQTRMTNTLSALIRSYGDRSGRSRLSSDAKLKDAFIPRGNLLITGETIPDLVESGLARLLIMKIHPDAINKNLLSDLQSKTNLLSQSMSGYINWLRSKTDTLTSTLAGKFDCYRNQAQSNNNHLRIAETVSWLQIGYEMFIDYAIFNGVIDEGERDSLLNEARMVFLALGDSQAELIKNDDPVNMFLIAISEMLTSEKCSFIKLNEEYAYKSGHYTVESGSIGYVDSEYYYLFSSIAYSAVNEFYKRQDIFFPVSKNTLFSQLEDEGLITIEVQKNRIYREKVKNIDGKNRRLLWLKRSAIDNLNGGVSLTV